MKTQWSLYCFLSEVKWHLWMLNAYGYEYVKVQIFTDNGTRKVNEKILIFTYNIKLIFFLF